MQKRPQKPILVLREAISAAYKGTALKAAEYMPAEGTLELQAQYVHDTLTAEHPDIAWGVELVKYTPGKQTDTSFMLYSPKVSQLLALEVGGDLFF